MKKSSGESAFFTTVANYKENLVPVTSNGEWEYWDFGTYQQYFDQMNKVVEKMKNKESSKLINFIKDQNIYSEDQLQEALSKNVISLMEGDFVINKEEINFKGIIQEI